MFVVDFLDHGDNKTVQHYCSTPERLKQAICCKRPGLLCQSMITLHVKATLRTANQTCDWLQLERYGPPSLVVSI